MNLTRRKVNSFILFVCLIFSVITVAARPKIDLLQSVMRITAYDMAVEGDYLYLVGSASDFSGTLPGFLLDFSGEMKDIWLVKMAGDGTPVFSMLIGGENDDTAYSLAVNQGVIYIAGETWSGNFPGAPGNAGESDSILLSVAADGSQILWARRFGGSDQDSARAVAFQEDALFFSGITWSQDLLPGQAKGDADGFVARVNLTGEMQWLQQFGGSGLDSPNAMAIDGGNLWIAGQTFSQNYGGTSIGGGDAFLARYDLDGEQQFAIKYGGRAEEIVFGIAVSADAGVYLTGGTQSSTWNGANGSFQDAVDCFLMKVDEVGSIGFVNYIGGDGIEYGRDVAILSDGNVLITGGTTSSIFPAGYDVSADSLGGEDAFILQTDPEGDVLSVLRKGSDGEDRGSRLGIMPNGIWLSGKYHLEPVGYVIFINNSDLGNVTLPTSQPVIPTATLAVTQTPQPTETQIATSVVTSDPLITTTPMRTPTKSPSPVQATSTITIIGTVPANNSPIVTTTAVEMVKTQTDESSPSEDQITATAIPLQPVNQVTSVITPGVIADQPTITPGYDQIVFTPTVKNAPVAETIVPQAPPVNKKVSNVPFLGILIAVMAILTFGIIFYFIKKRSG